MATKSTTTKKEPGAAVKAAQEKVAAKQADAEAQEKVAEDAEAQVAEAEAPKLSPMETKLMRGVPILVPEEYQRTIGRAGPKPREVKNLPSMFQVCWPSLPQHDGGWSISDARAKGYRPVEPDEVSMLDVPDKLWLASYEIVNGYVTVGGSVLFIGHRQSIEARKTAEQRAAAAELDALVEKALENENIEVQDVSREVDYSPLAHGRST